jgi:monovalent cation:H+ antiporter-2, CPA2 family
VPSGVLGASASADVAASFVELGVMALGLSILARLSDRVGLSPIPAYLLVGLAFGEGGIVSPSFSLDFIDLAAEIGVVLLLLTLGLEYTGQELRHGLARGWPAGLLDLALNFTPGFAIGLLLGWGSTGATLLGGVTYISSSGVIAKVLGDLGRLGNRETPSVLSILVLEDLAMAVYLPVIGVMLAGETFGEASVSVTVALGATMAVLVVALRYGEVISRVLAGRTDESVLLGVMGLTLLVAGLAQAIEVSAAVGAFLVGIALSGTVQERAVDLVGPLRDLFAATFFLLFGLRIDPADLPGALPIAVLLAVVTAGTKLFTGWWAARRAGIGPRGRLRAGTALVARGEFSIVIAGLAVGSSVDADLVPVSAAYVLLLAAGGPILTRFADPLSDLLQRRRAAEVPT